MSLNTCDFIGKEKRNRSFTLKVENTYVTYKKVSPAYLSVETDLSLSLKCLSYSSLLVL